MLGPYRLHFVCPYRPPSGKKWGIIPYANGRTLRAGLMCMHITDTRI